MDQRTRLEVVHFDGHGDPKTFPDPVPSPHSPQDYFVLQKIPGFGPSKVTVFLCSGLSSTGTALAVSLLANGWAGLRKQFPGRKENFALLYGYSPAPGKPPLKDVLEKNRIPVERVWPPSAVGEELRLPIDW